MKVRPKKSFSGFVQKILKDSDYKAIKNNLYDSILTSYSEYIVKNNLMVLLLELHILIISILHNEMIHSETMIEYQQHLLYFIIILSLMLILTILLGFYIEKRKDHLLTIMYPNLNLKKTTYFILIFKLFLCFIVPNPFFTTEGYQSFEIYSEIFEISFKYYFNDIMTVLMLLRFVTVLPAILGLSFMGKPTYTRLMFIHEIEHNFLFQIKYYIQKYTLKLSLVLFVLLIISFTIGIRILERPNPFSDFSNFYNSFYYTTVTITTIGYGDYVPKTPLGRLLATFYMLLGIVNLNLVNYSMMKFLEFSFSETRAFDNFHKSELKNKIRVKYLQFFYYLKRLNYLIDFQDKFFVKMLGNYYLLQLSSVYRELHNSFSEYENLNSFSGTNEEFSLKRELERNYDLIIKETSKIKKQLNILDKDCNFIHNLSKDNFENFK